MRPLARRPASAISRALEDRRLRDENRRLRAEVDHPFGLESIVGRSKPMLALFEQIGAVAGSDTTVLLLGESGTGKEPSRGPTACAADYSPRLMAARYSYRHRTLPAVMMSH
jgi:transcriptional regulator of aromatic amino acid metabolism